MASPDLLFREIGDLTVCSDCDIPILEFLAPKDNWHVRLAPTPTRVPFTLSNGVEIEPLTLLAVCPSCTQSTDNPWPEMKST